MCCTGAVESTATHVGRGDRRGRAPPGSPSAAPPAPTTGCPRPPWKTASARATSDGHDRRERVHVTEHATRPAAAGHGRSVDDGKSTLVGRLLYDTKSVLADQLERRRAASAGTRRLATSTSRCSPTACAPSASRASRSTSPTATSPPPRARSSSPTPPGTCSTPATWSPAPPPPSSRSCWSTPATACVEQTRRHAAVAALLRVPHVVLAVNKMDLVDYDEAVFTRDRRGVHRATPTRSGIADVDGHPGLGAARRQRRRPLDRARPGTTARRCWSTSSRVPVGPTPPTEPLRFPVQYVIRPQTRRAPRLPRLRRPVASGTVRVGDAVDRAAGRPPHAIAGIDRPVDTSTAPLVERPSAGAGEPSPSG